MAAYIIEEALTSLLVVQPPRHRTWHSQKRANTRSCAKLHARHAKTHIELMPTYKINRWEEQLFIAKEMWIYRFNGRRGCETNSHRMCLSFHLKRI